MMIKKKKILIFVFIYFCIFLILKFYLIDFFNLQNSEFFILSFTIALFVINYLFIFLTDKKIESEIIKLNEITKNIAIGKLNFSNSFKSEFENLNLSINSLLSTIESEFSKFKKIENYRREFLGNVSHEIRTPLFAIQSSIETLLDGAINDEEVNRDFLQRALKNLKRLDNLLKDLIEISNIETGELPMSFRYFEISNLLDSVVNEFLPIASKKNIKIEIICESQNLKVYGDKEKLFQVLSNLIDNAINYSDKNKKIILEVIDNQNNVTIKVIDEGFGIGEEHLNRIFERFYRTDKSRSRDVGGTGLGLSIAKHIIEAHNSVLKVESKLGSGSTFFFILQK